MAFASRALLLARFRTLPANNGVVRPLAAAGSLFLLPAGTTAKAVAMCLAARRLSSSRPPKETPATNLQSIARAGRGRPSKWMEHHRSTTGEPFINGKAVPYDPKYHKEWVRNNDRDNQRCPNLDRSSVRRDNMENFQNRDMPTRRTRSKSPSPQCQQTMEPHDDVPPVHHAQENMPLPPPSPSNGDPPTYQDHVKSPQTSDIPSFEQNCRQCGAPVHQVGNQDLQDSPDHRICDDNTDARMRDDNNNGCQRGRSDYQNGSAEAGQTTLHGANARPRQSGSEPGIQGQAVHRHYYCNVHYHYYY
nr:unnamed protein product [Digitaria exilis]